MWSGCGEGSKSWDFSSDLLGDSPFLLVLEKLCHHKQEVLRITMGDNETREQPLQWEYRLSKQLPG